MSLIAEKLQRGQRPYTINLHQADQINLWDSPVHTDRQNLTVRDANGDNVMTLYALTEDQLANLYLEIAHVLQKPPEPTLHHLKKIHKSIGKLIETAKRDQIPQFENDDSFGVADSQASGQEF